MADLFEIEGLNIYLQIFFTLLSFLIHQLYFKHIHNQKLAMDPKQTTLNKETTAEALLLFTIGLSGWFSIISGLFGHILYADQVAQSIGWPINSGFQMELGVSAIGIGLLGFLGFWYKSFWMPFIITKSSLMLGAGITHLIHLFAYGNQAAGNAGIVLYWDFMFPLYVIGLYLVVVKQKKNKIFIIKNLFDPCEKIFI